MRSRKPICTAPTRRTFHALALSFPFLPTLLRDREVQRGPDGEPRFVAPPGEPSPDERARIEAIVEALAADRKTTNEVLADSAVDALRPFPLFREAIAKHAREPRGRTVAEGESGTPLRIELRVLDPDGEPCADALVYAYHTSAKGWYAAEAPHVSGESGDHRFARLFTYARTDAKGHCELACVRPGPYPRSELPSHVHVVASDREGALMVTEVRFEDCPRMTLEMRERSLREGFAVVPVELAVDGSARCAAELRTKR